MKLLMISGDRALVHGKKGAFYNTLEEFHKYWERIDIITPGVRGYKNEGVTRLGVPHGAQTTVEHHGGEEGQDPVVFDNVFIHSSPWPLVFQPWWILKKGKEIYREQKFDLMTVHEYPPFYNGIGARMLWKKIRVPYVLEIFHIPGYPKAGNLKEKIYRRFFYSFIKYDCRKAKAVRVMNNQIARKLVSLGVPESKIKLIPAIYIDLDVFKPLSLGKKYDLIFVGRLVKNKGINLLLEAASKLKIQNSNFKMFIVGSGPLENHLKFKIENLKLKDNVLFYGWAKDSQEVAKLLNQSKVLVMPSYNEGGPRVVIEAMACGVPVLATPVGFVPEIIGGAGEVVSWDPAEIADKFEALASDERKYREYSQKAVETAKNFEKKTMIRNYAEKLRSFVQ